MTIPFTCPHCGRHTDVDERYGGQTGECADCGLAITIPTSLQVRAQQKHRRLVRREDIGLLIAIVTATLAAGVVLVIGAVRFLPDSLRRMNASSREAICQRQLREISLALLQYEREYGHLPPPVVRDAQGKALHSWRVALLPYLGADARSIYAQYKMEEPWDSPHNSAVTSRTPEAYRCPADDTIISAETSYVLVVGPGTIFDGKQAATTQRADAGDGAQMTLMIVESHGSGIGWAEPRDIDIVQLARGVNPTALQTVRSKHDDGAFGATCDGTILKLPAHLSGSELRGLATCNGAEPPPDVEIVDGRTR
jgi:hypothetical protein